MLGLIVVCRWRHHVSARLQTELFVTVQKYQLRQISFRQFGACWPHNKTCSTKNSFASCWACRSRENSLCQRPQSAVSHIIEYFQATPRYVFVWYEHCILLLDITAFQFFKCRLTCLSTWASDSNEVEKLFFTGQLCFLGHWRGFFKVVGNCIT